MIQMHIIHNAKCTKAKLKCIWYKCNAKLNERGISSWKAHKGKWSSPKYQLEEFQKERRTFKDPIEYHEKRYQLKVKRNTENQIDTNWNRINWKRPSERPYQLKNQLKRPNNTLVQAPFKWSQTPPQLKTSSKEKKARNKKKLEVKRKTSNQEKEAPTPTKKLQKQKKETKTQRKSTKSNPKTSQAQSRNKAQTWYMITVRG